MGKSPRIFSFLDAQCSVRRADGAFIHLSIPPFPAVVHEQVSARKWDEAARLCRFVKDKALWSCLALWSAELRHLATAENAYAAIDEVVSLTLDCVSHHFADCQSRVYPEHQGDPNLRRSLRSHGSILPSGSMPTMISSGLTFSSLMRPSRFFFKLDSFTELST